MPLRQLQTKWYIRNSQQQTLCIYKDIFLACHFIHASLLKQFALSISPLKFYPQANNSVLNDIEQYRRNHWYSSIVQTMRNHSGLTKTFLDQLIMRYLNLRFYCYILAVSVNRISMCHQLQVHQHRHSNGFSM